MKNFLLPLLVVVLLGACDWDYGYWDLKGMPQELQGTWGTNDPDSIYSGTLSISHDRITISGYGERQTPFFGDDEKRPFRNYTKGMPLKAYSEEGVLFIEDGGFWLAGIPFNYWYVDSSSYYGKVHFLRFEFGGRTETLRKKSL